VVQLIGNTQTLYIMAVRMLGSRVRIPLGDGCLCVYVMLSGVDRGLCYEVREARTLHGP
jgi:hypothetical protein